MDFHVVHDARRRVDDEDDSPSLIFSCMSSWVPLTYDVRNFLKFFDPSHPRCLHSATDLYDKIHAQRTLPYYTYADVICGWYLIAFAVVFVTSKTAKFENVR